MADFTACHWGLYEISRSPDGTLKSRPVSSDPDPSKIGVPGLEPEVKRLRVAHPAVRRCWLEHGPGAATDRRGTDEFVEVTWDTALDLVAREIGRVREKFGNQSIYGGSYGWASAGRFHHAQSQIHRFLNCCGGFVRHVDSYSIGGVTVMLPHVIAPMKGRHGVQTNHTSWDVLARNTRLFAAFGGLPAKNMQVSPGGAGLHHAATAIRSMARAGTKFINIGPVNDNLEGGPTVEWIPLRPNTDTALMLGLAWVLRDEDLLDRNFLAKYCVGFEQFERYLLGTDDGIRKDPPWAEQITGVPAGRIVSLAREMAATRTMLNIARALQRAAYGEEPCWMVVTLAAMLGQIGLPGGGFGIGYGAMNFIGSEHANLHGPTLPQGNNAVTAFIPVARISDMLLHPGDEFTYDGGRYAYPDIHLLYWAGGNPFHHHQDLNKLLLAWRRPETIIVHEQFWTPTAKRSDIVLPVTTSIERNDICYSTREGYLVAMRKVADPFEDARNDFDIFSGVAARLGVDAEFTDGLDERGWLVRLYGEAKDSARDEGIELPDFDAFWERGMVLLGKYDHPVVMFSDFRASPEQHPLVTPSGKIELFSSSIANFHLADFPGHACWHEPPEWLGSDRSKKYPLHLLSDQPARRLHSQLDAGAWSQAGKVNGREPVYVNSEDARKRGIADGDVVEVFNDRGRCLAGVITTPSIMPGVVRIATGAWFDPDDGTGVEQRGNPNVLTLDVGASGLSQACSAQTCLVEIRGPVADPPAVRAYRLPVLATAEGDGSHSIKNRA